jgi:predicted metalloendopeptidase
MRAARRVRGFIRPAEGTTGDQRFFMARAQGRPQITREAALRKEVLNNEHAPAVYRVNGIVRNTDAWYPPSTSRRATASI